MRAPSLLLLITLIAVFALPAQQDEGDVYFSVNVDKPVLPGESAKVRVMAQGLRSLNIRLYRINSPEQFFKKLEDPHSFGGTIRPTPQARTPIEKFSRWKRSMRSSIVNVLRGQFTSPQRARIRAAFTGEKPLTAGKKGQVDFAEISILNPQQLVRTWEQPILTPQRWDSATVPVELKNPGVYVLEATDGRKMAYTLLSATSAAIVSKASPGSLTFRILDRRTGASLPGYEVIGIDTMSKREVFRVQAGESGMQTVPIKQVSGEGLILIASKGRETAITTPSGYGILDEEGTRFTAFVYTDRPIYRPGHTVHFRAMLRVAEVQGYKIPGWGSVDASVEDSSGKRLYSRSLRISRFGTVSGEFDLPKNAETGYYAIQLSHDETSGYGGFHVEEYRKPEFSVSITPDAPRVLQGSKAKAVISARYYYGEPLPGAKVQWRVQAMRFYPPWWDPEEEQEQEAGDEGGFDYDAEQLSEQSGTLDQDGRLIIELPTNAAPNDLRYRILATVTDTANRAVEGSGALIATRGEFFLQAQPLTYVVSPGETSRIEVTAHDYDGKLLPGISISAAMRKYDWRRDRERPRGETVSESSARTGADGKAQLSLRVKESGPHRVEVTARTASGRTVSDDAFVYCSGTGAWWSQNQERIQIIPDKATYQPGDTARLLLVTGGERASVWFSIEGKTIHTSRVVEIQGPSTTIEVPIADEYEPNVFAEAVFVRDNTLFRGSRMIKVPATGKKLDLKITSDKPIYLPGEPAVIQLEARDAQGKPAQAEVSVGVVDEAIYALQPDRSGNPFQTFYARDWNRVSTDSSLSYYFWGHSGRRRIQLAGMRPSDSRAQLKPEPPLQKRVRRSFPDTAHWVANLITDANGRASTKFEYPDALTMWRATARGITSDTKVGASVDRTTVRKNLLLAIPIPRFLTEGDELVLPVIVRNYLAQAESVKVVVQVKGADVLAAEDGEYAVPSRGEKKLLYRLKAKPGGPIVVTAAAVGKTERDDVELTFPVLPYGLPRANSAMGVLDSVNYANTSVPFPAPSAAYSRAATIQVSPSVAGVLFGALDYLLQYPYGCTEQTLASLTPNLVVASAIKELKLETRVKPEELNKKINAGLDRLYALQNGEGGWGWWRGEDSNPYLTAYATYALHQAHQAGYAVPEDRLTHADKALREQFNTPPQALTADTRAWQLYSLATAKRATAADVRKVVALDKGLTALGWALTGLAALEMGDTKTAGAVALRLDVLARRAGVEAWWSVERDTLFDYSIDNSVEATAFALKFLVREGTPSPLIDQAAYWLVNHRSQGIWWANTRQTSMAVFGLVDYLVRSGELKRDFSYDVLINGKSVLSGRFGERDALAAQPAIATIEGGDALNVEVRKSGKGRLYWSVRAEARTTDEQFPAPRADGPSIHREYYRLQPVTHEGRRIYEPVPLESEPQPGDLIAVRLRANAKDERYLLVEDPIPAGAEVILRDSGYEIRNRPRWWDYFYDRRDVRDNRVSYLVTTFGAIVPEFWYLLRITHEGSFRVAPPRLEPMYRPEILAAGAATTLTVKEAPRP